MRCVNDSDSVWLLQVLLVLRGSILKNAAKQILVENKDIVRLRVQVHCL